jgi:hypothetical protein
MIKDIENDKAVFDFVHSIMFNKDHNETVKDGEYWIN